MTEEANRLEPCPLADREARVRTLLGYAAGYKISKTDALQDCSVLARHAVTVAIRFADEEALRTPSPTNPVDAVGAEGVEREWPDIGVEPLTLPRPRDIEETKGRLRAAAVVQQPHVPNGTALVWRTDLLDTHHRAIRIEALSELRGEQLAALRAQPVEHDALAGELRIPSEPDNHHNAATCAYCTKNGKYVLVEKDAIAALSRQPVEADGGQCPYDGRACYVAAGTDDAHYRCGTSACPRTAQAGSEDARENERLREKCDKFMWQVRDTCVRAERVEGLVAIFREALEEIAAPVVCPPQSLDEAFGQREAIRDMARTALETPETRRG